MPYAADHLMEGLDRLAEDASPAIREFGLTGLPANWSAVVGECDPVLEAATICRVIKGCRTISGARHRFEDLLGPALEGECHAV
jgi:hypothetical protein